jgi:pimeloyl-ACP methyl ester carboxylesterase
MHCKSDEIVPDSHAYQLKDAYPRAELVLFDGCSHAELYRDYPEKYLATVLGFLSDKWV